MAKIRIEVCLISARGLPRPSSFLKPQWFAVGWIDPTSKYCTKIDASGSANPTWKTKFSAAVDEAGLQGLALTVEVYRREPIFLREKLQGTTVVPLKEFLVRFLNDAEASRSGRIKESGSFQLRKRNGKAIGFVDLSIEISQQTSQDFSSRRAAMDGGFSYANDKEGIAVAIEDGPVLPFPSYPPPPPTLGGRGGYDRINSHAYNNPTTPGASSSSAAYHHHQRPPPPPPPPPSNTGFLPTLFPGAAPLPETYINLPPSGGARASQGSGGGAAGLGMGLGAGALAAGAVIFGDDFLSAGSSFPMGFQADRFTVSTDDDTLF